MPKELTFREIQLRELDILRTVAYWLEEQGITYSLTGGTLLGAIRHKGFIPWDDDVDICLPRPHYRRMCQLLRKQDCRIGDVEAHLPGEKDYRFSFVKFMDPCTISTGGSGKGRIPLRIDAFPMDRLPVDSLRYRRNMRTFHRLRLILWSATRKREDVPEFRGNGRKSRIKWWLCRATGVLAGGYRNVARLVDLHGRWVDWRNRKGWASSKSFSSHVLISLLITAHPQLLPVHDVSRAGVIAAMSGFVEMAKQTMGCIEHTSLFECA